jgi:hypothetical protein
MSARILALLLALATSVGCGTVTTYRFPLDRPTGTVAKAPPAVFFEGQMPSTGMRELVMVEAVGSGTKASVEHVVNAMQDEAARWGANAIVRVKVDCGYSQCHGWAVAVQYVSK